MKKPAFSIKLNAKNDNNGNPRRVFVVFDKDGNIIKAIDEGYKGPQPLLDYFDKQGVVVVYGGEFASTATERNQLLRDFG